MKVYAYQNSNNDIRMNSTSGGAFTALSDYVLENKGAVYGAVLIRNEVVHIRGTTVQERDMMRGSKYVQSNISGMFQLIKKDLVDGVMVLFSGTPCQVSAVKKFLGPYASHELFYVCDIICHGVPSPKVFSEYLKYYQKKNNISISKVVFRDKNGYKWENCHESVYDGELKFDFSGYAKLFYGHESLRPSCYQCHFTNLNRPGDITLGDYWGIEKIDSGFNDGLGTSLVLINTEKGNFLFEKTLQCGICKESDLCFCVQPQLYHPVKVPWQRNWFWKKWRNKGSFKTFEIYESKYSLFRIMTDLVEDTKHCIKSILNCIRR